MSLSTETTENSISKCSVENCPFNGFDVNGMLRQLSSTRNLGEDCAKSTRTGMSTVMRRLFAIGCMRIQGGSSIIENPSGTENL